MTIPRRAAYQGATRAQEGGFSFRIAAGSYLCAFQGVAPEELGWCSRRGTRWLSLDIKTKAHRCTVGFAPPGLEPRATFWGNQGSPDPDGAVQHREFQQLAKL